MPKVSHNFNDLRLINHNIIFIKYVCNGTCTSYVSASKVLQYSGFKSTPIVCDCFYSSSQHRWFSMIKQDGQARMAPATL